MYTSVRCQRPEKETKMTSATRIDKTYKGNVENTSSIGNLKNKNDYDDTSSSRPQMIMKKGGETICDTPQRHNLTSSTTESSTSTLQQQEEEPRATTTTTTTIEESTSSSSSCEKTLVRHNHKNKHRRRHHQNHTQIETRTICGVCGIVWDGQFSTFREIKERLDGALIVGGLGYIVDPEFIQHYANYKMDSSNPASRSSRKSTIYKHLRRNHISTRQFRYDQTVFGGVLRQVFPNAGLPRIYNSKFSKEPILAYHTILNECSPDENIMKTIYETMINTPYTSSYPGGMLQYSIDIEMAYHELERITQTKVCEKEKFENLLFLLQHRGTEPSSRSTTLVQICELNFASDEKDCFDKALRCIRKDAVQNVEAICRLLYSAAVNNSNNASPQVGLTAMIHRMDEIMKMTELSQLQLQKDLTQQQQEEQQKEATTTSTSSSCSWLDCMEPKSGNSSPRTK